MQPIASSELILNSRGAIYHLDTLPSEIATTIITVGDPNRVPDVSQHFDSIEIKNTHREFVVHTGYIGTKHISCVATGIGPDNIDIVLNELDALVNIDFETRLIKPSITTLQILRLGTSGSLQAHIAIDSYVVSTHAIGIDNMMNYYKTETNNEIDELLQAFNNHTNITNITQPYAFAASSSLLAKFTSGFHHGVTVTCPGFYGPQGRVLRLPIVQPQLINSLTSFRHGNLLISNFEMETAAIYGLCNALGHKCISLSAMVANRVTGNFSTDGKKLVDGLIAKALPIIELM